MEGESVLPWRHLGKHLFIGNLSNWGKAHDGERMTISTGVPSGPFACLNQDDILKKGRICMGGRMSPH